MAESFLKSIAETILERFGAASGDVCVVFSNRRARLFYQQELQRLHPSTQWLPALLSMEEFVQQLTGFNLIDPIALLFEFYEVYRGLESEKAESFEQFSSWATQLLHDYEEADLYLLETAKFFRHVDQAYALKNWSPDGQTLTSNQERYLAFWSRMGLWYSALREQLHKQNSPTQAMAFRHLAENAQALAASIPWKHIVFAGFNALNQAEQRFIRAFEKIGMASLYWDSDSYYLDNVQNEAGYFMRQFKSNYGLSTLKFTNQYFTETKKTINITGVSRNTGQAVFAGSLIQGLMQSASDLKETALVLCDESLLIPVLEQLPAETGQVNVTMGYPLHLLSEATFFQILFDLRAHAKKGKNSIAWYHKDLLRLFQHPLTAQLLPGSFLRQCQHILSKGQLVFVGLERIQRLSKASEQEQECLAMLLSDWNADSKTAISNLREITEALRTALYQGTNGSQIMRQEALFALSNLFNKLQTYLDKYPAFDSLKTLQRLFEQLLRQSSLPFYGEPLDGLQVMGLLETRNLDFKNIILLSVNEGILPKGRSQNSFIPIDIGAAYGLPGYRERDAVYAWHFYRLLQRAENIHLVYNTEPDEFAKGEKSRFIAQLEEELKVQGTIIQHDIWVPDVKAFTDPEIKIEKSKALMERLYKRFGKENDKFLSPSALSLYLDCSLHFYFKYLSGLKIEDELEDDIGDDVLGIIVHKVLQDFFEPLKGKKVQESDYIEMLKALPVKIAAVFAEKVDEEVLMQGKNFLIFKAAEQMLGNYLREEMRVFNAQGQALEIIELELLMKDAMQAESDLGCLQIGGFADRIDLIGDKVIRIIDYKTGIVDAKTLKIESLNDIYDKDGMGKALQLLLYSHLAKKAFPGKQIQAGIISLRKPSSGLLAFEHQLADVEDVNLFFEKMANKLVQNDTFFEKTDDLSKCIYCDFQKICNRISS